MTQAFRVPPMSVVVVDDYEDGAEMLAEALRTAGHSVRVAYRGLSTLQLFQESVPDIAFMDLGLPDMDGLDLARAVRERFGSSLKLVAITGHGGQQEMEHALSAGFDEVIVKPYRLRELLSVVPSAAASSCTAPMALPAF